MPRVNWDNADNWSQFYGATVNGARVGYSREWAYMENEGFNPEQSETALRRNALIALGIQTSHRVLIAGCGYGFLIERFHVAGYPNVWGIDSSPYIAASQGTEIDGSILMVTDDICILCNRLCRLS